MCNGTPTVDYLVDRDTQTLRQRSVLRVYGLRSIARLQTMSLCVRLQSCARGVGGERVGRKCLKTGRLLKPSRRVSLLSFQPVPNSSDGQNLFAGVHSRRKPVSHTGRRIGRANARGKAKLCNRGCVVCVVNCHEK